MSYFQIIKSFHRLSYNPKCHAITKRHLLHLQHLRHHRSRHSWMDLVAMAILNSVMTLISALLQKGRNTSNDFLNFVKWTLSTPFGKWFICLFLHKKCKFVNNFEFISPLQKITMVLHKTNSISSYTKKWTHLANTISDKHHSFLPYFSMTLRYSEFCI